MVIQHQYSILANLQSIISIQNGEPIHDKLRKNEWHYYRFKVTNNPIIINIGITMISGNVNLYVLLNKEPNEIEYNNKLITRYHDENIIINHKIYVQITIIIIIIVLIKLLNVIIILVLNHIY